MSEVAANLVFVIDSSTSSLRPRTDGLLPWDVRPEHRVDLDFVMLRLERRRRSGLAVPVEDIPRLDAWLSQLDRHRSVVHYEPTVGFGLVPSRPGIDTDLIRAP